MPTNPVHVYCTVRGQKEDGVHVHCPRIRYIVYCTVVGFYQCSVSTVFVFFSVQGPQPGAVHALNTVLRGLPEVPGQLHRGCGREHALGCLHAGRLKRRKDRYLEQKADVFVRSYSLPSSPQYLYVVYVHVQKCC